MINLKPELVEKKDPPIMTKIKYMKLKFDWLWFKEKPILDILLEIDKRLIEKLLLNVKNKKKIEIIIIK